jgi:hypothetical protein
MFRLSSRRGQRRMLAQDAFSRWLDLEGSYYDQATQTTIAYQNQRAYLGGPAMFGAGLIAGLLGIGGGALKVLVFDLVMGLPAKVSTTTSYHKQSDHWRDSPGWHQRLSGIWFGRSR